MSKHLWLLDAGHGGMKDGRYTTAPAKMHVFDDGLVFYEGVNNRMIAAKLQKLLQEHGIDHTLVYDAELDTPLSQRVALANYLHHRDPRCIYLSLHSDAMPPGAHGKGSGFSVYTSKGQTASDAIAEIFCRTYQRRLAQFRFRKNLIDGDLDQEEDFYVLRKTTCPALLVENLFFDNRREAEYLLSDTGRTQIALTLFEAILQTEASAPFRLRLRSA